MSDELIDQLRQLARNISSQLVQHTLRLQLLLDDQRHKNLGPRSILTGQREIYNNRLGRCDELKQEQNRVFEQGRNLETELNIMDRDIKQAQQHQAELAMQTQLRRQSRAETITKRTDFLNNEIKKYSEQVKIQEARESKLKNELDALLREKDRLQEIINAKQRQRQQESKRSTAPGQGRGQGPATATSTSGAPSRDDLKEFLGWIVQQVKSQVIQDPSYNTQQARFIGQRLSLFFDRCPRSDINDVIKKIQARNIKIPDVLNKEVGWIASKQAQFDNEICLRLRDPAQSITK